MRLHCLALTEKEYESKKRDKKKGWWLDGNKERYTHHSEGAAAVALPTAEGGKDNF